LQQLILVSFLSVLLIFLPLTAITSRALQRAHC